MNRSSQAGTALFLILVAVVLFAALSYAITLSGRGGGDISKEQELLDSARAVQYIGALRQGIVRMTVNGTDFADLEFCTSGPGTCSVTVDELCTSGENCVFAPEGGGVSAQFLDEYFEATPFEIYSQAAIANVGTAATDQRLQITFSGTGPNISLCNSIVEGLGSNETGTCSCCTFGLGSLTIALYER